MKYTIIKSLQKLNFPKIKIYIFGSTITSSKKFSDLDLLIIYEDIIDLDFFRKKISTYSDKYPIDLIFLTKLEEKELNFVYTTNAILLDDFHIEQLVKESKQK